MSHSLRVRAVVLSSLFVVAACGESAKTPAVESQPAPAVTQLPPFEVDVPSLKASVTLPGAWKDAFVMSEKADTTLGATRVVEFRYPGDSSVKIPPRLLLAVRAFPKAAWSAMEARKVQIATKVGERGGDVFAYSIVGGNPYPMNTTAGLRVEAMMLALVASDSPFKLTLK